MTDGLQLKAQLAVGDGLSLHFGFVTLRPLTGFDLGLLT